MTIARAHLVDRSVSRWYHCLTRCVRRAFLLGEGPNDRKAWIESRLQELAEIFAVSVAGFSVMDNHLHLLVRLDPDVVTGWSDEDVVRALHEQAALLLAAEFRSNTEQSPEDRRAIGEDISAQVVRAHVDGRRQAGERLSDECEQRLLDTVLAYLFGLGRLQAATDDPDVANVMVLGHDRVRIEYADGSVETGPPAAANDHELLHLYLGDEMFDEMAHAYVKARPSGHPNLRWFSQGLPEFLRANAPYGQYPVLGDLAALEKALNDAFDGSDGAVVTL